MSSRRTKCVPLSPQPLIGLAPLIGDGDVKHLGAAHLEFFDFQAGRADSLQGIKRQDELLFPGREATQRLPPAP
jgi:hypothetical protein